MSETTHQRAQREARERKATLRATREADEKDKAFRRACRIYTIQKDELLRVLIDECLIPADATRIVATGHLPDKLTVTVTSE